jgi:hypothetical protein
MLFNRSRRPAEKKRRPICQSADLPGDGKSVGETVRLLHFTRVTRDSVIVCHSGTRVDDELPSRASFLDKLQQSIASEGMEGRGIPFIC